MTSDDLDDIKAGLDSLRKAMQSIRDALSAVDRMPDSNDKRDAEIALTHAEETAGLAERQFRLVIGDQSREARKKTVDAHADALAEDSEPDVE